MLDVIILLILVIVSQGYYISILRDKLKDANWRLPNHDRYHGDIFNGK